MAGLYGIPFNGASSVGNYLNDQVPGTNFQLRKKFGLESSTDYINKNGGNRSADRQAMVEAMARVVLDKEAIVALQQFGNIRYLQRDIPTLMQLSSVLDQTMIADVRVFIEAAVFLDDIDITLLFLEKQISTLGAFVQNNKTSRDILSKLRHNHDIGDRLNKLEGALNVFMDVNGKPSAWNNSAMLAQNEPTYGDKFGNQFPATLEMSGYKPSDNTNNNYARTTKNGWLAGAGNETDDQYVNVFGQPQNFSRPSLLGSVWSSLVGVVSTNDLNHKKPWDSYPTAKGKYGKLAMHIKPWLVKTYGQIQALRFELIKVMSNLTQAFEESKPSGNIAEEFNKYAARMRVLTPEMMMILSCRNQYGQIDPTQQRMAVDQEGRPIPVVIYQNGRMIINPQAVGNQSNRQYGQRETLGLNRELLKGMLSGNTGSFSRAVNQYSMCVPNYDPSNTGMSLPSIGMAGKSSLYSDKYSTIPTASAMSSALSGSRSRRTSKRGASKSSSSKKSGSTKKSKTTKRKRT